MATLLVLRRQLVLIVPIAALALSASASAALRPVDRTFGDVTVPRVTHGTLRVPEAQRSGRVTVIATLRLLRRWRPRADRGSSQRWARAGSTPRARPPAYLARIQAEQAAATRAIRTPSPRRFGYRFQVVLNGLGAAAPAEPSPPPRARVGWARTRASATT